MKLDVWVKSLLLGSAFALMVSGSSQAAIVVQDQDTFAGTQQQSNQYDFSLAPGTFKATLSDVGVFAPFAFLSMIITENGGSFLSFSSLTPTSLTFSIPDSEAGAYRATISGIPGVISGHTPAAESTYTFSITALSGSDSVSAVPETEVWAMMAAGIGFLGWRLRTTKST
jgi:hypothetical protein